MNTPRTSASASIARLLGMQLCTVLLLATVLLHVSCGSDRVNAAEIPIGPIRRTYVPADRPELWPMGRWEALPINEFRKLEKDLALNESTPLQTLLKHVNYSATWSENAFIEGELTAEVGLSGFEPKYHSLGQPTLSLTDFSWQDRPAEWGTDPEGRSLIRVESDGSQLQGHWSLRGHEVLGDVEFDVVLPPSFISRFELRLPSEKHLSVEDGLFAITLDDAVPGWKRWILDLGNRSQLRFTITDELPRLSLPHLVTQRKSQYRLSPDQLRFTVTFRIDNLGSPIEELIFDVPAELTISSISLGNDAELPFHRISGDGRSGVVVPLKSITLNSRSSFTLHGEMPLGSERNWKLPRISLTKAQLTESLMSIVVHRPLELTDYSSKECRLISSSMNRNQADSLDFEDWADTSEVSVTLDTPQVDVVSDILATVSGDLSQSTMRTLLKLTTRSGSVYKLPCLVPPGWKVTGVTSIPWKRPNIVSQWRVSTTDDGGSQLTVEFRDALTSEQSVIIEVIARRAFDPAASSMNLPMVRPLDGMPRSVAMVLTPVAGQEFSLADDSAYVELSLAEATASWTSELESTQWLDVAGNPAVLDGQRFVVFTDSPSDADQLMITTSRERILPMLAESRIATPKASADQLSSASSFGTGSTLSSVSKQLTADVTVETTVPEIREHPCVHHVKYALPALAAGAKLQFALSEPASFISWKGNGTSEPILISDRLLQIQLPDTGDSFDVDLEYRSPFSQTLLAGEAIIPLPQSTVIKSDVSWKITLPPSYRMIPSTTGTSCEQSSVSWTHRLIGPLSRISGRDLNSSVRTVDQQRGDLAEFAVLQTDTAVAGQNRFLTRNNNEHTRSVPFSVGVLKLQIWKEDTSCRVGWLLMIAGCMAIGVIRRIQPQHCTFILFACAVSSGLVSAIVPDAFAILGGGLFFGILCGMFLPEKLWNHRVTVVNRPIGSTHRAPVFAGAGILFASIGIWSSSYANAMQNNQPGGTTTSPAMKSSESSARYDALIPIRSKQATLNETPVAYVSPALLERWRSHRQAKQRSPDYLLRDAEYELTLNQRPFPRMSAVFDVVHLNPLARHINIPLGGIAIDGEDACTVNGQVATIIPLKTSRGVSIDLDSIIPPSLPMDETEGRFVTSEADGRDDRANVLRIMIDCRLRSHKNGDLHQVNVAIPPLLSTKAALQHDGNDADFPWIHRLGSESRNGADQPARIELGPVKSLQIDWRPHGSEPASEAFIPHVAMTNIVVHPQHLKATTCLAYVVKGPSGTGVTPSIVFSVPPYAQVNNVRAPGLQSWKMRYHDTEPVAVRLTFVEPLNIQTVIVECEYVLPATLSDGKVTIPSFFSNMGQETSGFPVHSLGLSAAAGFRIEHLPALHQSNQVVRLSPDQFTQDWAAEDNVRCDLAYSLKAPQPLGVKVAPILPECRASISEIVTINLQAWQWEADIDLTSQDTPDVLHRLTLNPDITITSASVTDGGADVLSRWTRTTDQEQLLLLLTNEVSGSQRIHLTGEFMVKMGEPAHLSDFAVENAVVSQHTLTLQLHSDLSVEAFDSLERPISLAEDEAGVVDDPGLLDQHTFDLLSDVAPASIRIDAAASEFSFERLVTVDTGQEGQWFLTTEFIFPMDRKLPRQIQVVVPREFAGVENGLKSSPQAEHSSLNDGRLMLTFRTTTPDFVARRVEIMLKTSPKQDSAWQIPQVKVLNGLPKDEWLVLMPYATHELRGQFSSIEAEKLPDRFILTNGIDAVDKAVFRSTHGDWTLIPRSLSGTNGVVRRLDTVIWDANSEELCGVTVADVSVRNLNQFAIALPRGLRVTYVDSRDVIDSPVMDDSVSELVVPVPEVAGDRDTSCLLKVGWTLPKTSFAMRYDIPLLRPKELPVIRQRMVFLGSGDSRYEATSSSIFLELAAVNLLSDQASKESSPFIRPLEAAGCFRSSNDASSILMATVEQNSSQQPEAVVSMWRLNKQFRRFLLVLLISILGLIMGWKTRLLHLLREQILRLSQSPYAGPTVLAVLIWISGPVVLGITLTLLCIAVWGRALWKAYGRTTDFEYSPITTS